MLVLGTVASDRLDLTIVTADRNRKSDDIVASSNQLEVVFGDSGFGSSAVEEKFDLLEETRFFGFVFHSRERSNAYKDTEQLDRGFKKSQLAALLSFDWKISYQIG